MTTFKFCLFVLTGGMLSGCANSSGFSLNLNDWEAERSATFWPKQCTSRIVPKVTHVPDRRSFGLASYRDLSIQEVDRWVEGVFAYPGNNSTRSVEMNLEVKKVYVQTSGAALVGNIIVTYQVRQSGKLLKEQTHFGHKATINWNSNDSEIVDILEGALEDVATKIEGEVNQLCSQNIAV